MFADAVVVEVVLTVLLAARERELLDFGDLLGGVLRGDAFATTLGGLVLEPFEFTSVDVEVVGEGVTTIGADVAEDEGVAEGLETVAGNFAVTPISVGGDLSPSSSSTPSNSAELYSFSECDCEHKSSEFETEPGTEPQIDLSL
mmetsp:Transcript_31031/g.60524  ORF Transcript_31031/g.60524 Transcript_31031/m.60524 type:complete len:144 (-) Transcript_31031:807-1238(-)